MLNLYQYILYLNFCPITEPPASLRSALHADSDEALALQLQQQLDREAAEAQTVDLEAGGLFFCQICHRDLSHMTPEGRAQHLNRSEHFYVSASCSDRHPTVLMWLLLKGIKSVITHLKSALFMILYANQLCRMEQEILHNESYLY